MKTIIKTLLICALIIGSFCFGKSFRTSYVEFPELNSAKQHLMEAKTNLTNAKKQFGGHRVKAVDLVDKAVKEIDEAIAYGDK